jgi:hypothetical protein
MSKSYTLKERKHEKCHVYITSHGTVNIKITTKEIPKYCCVLPLFKVSFGVPKCKAPNGGEGLHVK